MRAARAARGRLTTGRRIRDPLECARSLNAAGLSVRSDHAARVNDRCLGLCGPPLPSVDGRQWALKRHRDRVIGRRKADFARTATDLRLVHATRYLPLAKARQWLGRQFAAAPAADSLTPRK